MKKKKIYGIALLLVCGSILSVAEKVTANSEVSEVNSSFFVEQFKSTTQINNIADANRLIRRSEQATASGFYDTIDLIDGYGSSGRNPGGDLFPGIQRGEDNFAIRATANIIIPTAGDWTFLTNNDDGVHLTIDEKGVIRDNRPHPPADRLGDINLSAGVHYVELVFFERTGGATLELWAAQGSEAAFRDENNNINFQDFRLVGDTANGGIATTVPFDFSPSTGILLSLSFFGLHQIWKKHHRSL